MTYSLGLDGGGTKTECALLDEAGAVVGQGFGGASNPLRVGLDPALAALLVASSAALASAGISKDQVKTLCAGLAGAAGVGIAEPMEENLSRAFPEASVLVTTDLEVTLEAAAGSGPGVVLIAGTGSAAFGRDAAGRTARAGGQGPWISDEGSAFDIGRLAVAAVARSRDFAAPATSLAAAIPAALGIRAWEDVLARIAQQPNRVFPLVFSLVVKAANASDAVAMEILRHAADALAELAVTVVRRLRLEKTEFVLAKSGGVFARRSPLDARLDALLGNWFPRAKIGLLEVSPAAGAARLAARAAAGKRARPAAERSKHGRKN